MSTTPPQVLQLARQGDPNAIATLINQHLGSKGINASVTQQGDLLEVVLEAAQVPPQTELVNYVRTGISGLNLTTIHQLRVSGQQAGAIARGWTELVQLSGEISPPPTTLEFDSAPALADSELDLESTLDLAETPSDLDFDLAELDRDLTLEAQSNLDIHLETTSLPEDFSLDFEDASQSLEAELDLGLDLGELDLTNHDFDLGATPSESLDDLPLSPDTTLDAMTEEQAASDLDFDLGLDLDDAAELPDLTGELGLESNDLGLDLTDTSDEGAGSLEAFETELGFDLTAELENLSPGESELGGLDLDLEPVATTDALDFDSELGGLDLDLEPAATIDALDFDIEPPTTTTDANQAIANTDLDFDFDLGLDNGAEGAAPEAVEPLLSTGSGDWAEHDQALDFSGAEGLATDLSSLEVDQDLWQDRGVGEPPTASDLEAAAEQSLDDFTWDLTPEVEAEPAADLATLEGEPMVALDFDTEDEDEGEAAPETAAPDAAPFGFDPTLVYEAPPADLDTRAASPFVEEARFDPNLMIETPATSAAVGHGQPAEEQAQPGLGDSEILGAEQPLWADQIYDHEPEPMPPALETPDSGGYDYAATMALDDSGTFNLDQGLDLQPSTEIPLEPHEAWGVEATEEFILPEPDTLEVTADIGDEAIAADDTFQPADWSTAGSFDSEPWPDSADFDSVALDSVALEDAGLADAALEEVDRPYAQTLDWEASDREQSGLAGEEADWAEPLDLGNGPLEAEALMVESGRNGYLQEGDSPPPEREEADATDDFIHKFAPVSLEEVEQRTPGRATRSGSTLTWMVGLGAAAIALVLGALGLRALLSRFSLPSLPGVPSLEVPAPPGTGEVAADPFREAVNAAQNAANLAQTAKTSAEWQVVADSWAQAIALMKQVPESSPNYAVAQQKAVEYQPNLAYAQQNVQRLP
ncbi:MAG TPA: hypothetical protein IGR64_10970 [Leptolyngbyaceae cyanobacterium M65_K2018_010]|nr:hypothetical protein [Leptolyngbyaceae cyanobacterium M65_K2018_010]